MAKIFTLGLLMFSLPSLAQDTLTAIVFAPSGHPVPLRKTPDTDAKQIGIIDCADSVILISYDGSMFYKVATKSGSKKRGYLYIDFLQYDERAVQHINSYHAKAGHPFRLKYEKLPKAYASQVKKSYPTKSYSSGSSGRTIHTGPRGGKYYINKNGKKTYLKH